MDVVIFCGGRGTRLSEKTKETPKPLVEVGEYPILWHIMKIFSHYGNNRFVLTLGYKGSLIKHWFLNHRVNCSFEINLRDPVLPSTCEDWAILFKETGLESGTGHRLKQVEKDIKSDQFMLTYGDGVADVDIKKLVEFHNEMKRKHGVIITISGIQPNSKFGIINHTEDGIVTSFIEKPKGKEWANIGFMVCEKEVFKYLSDDPKLFFEDGPLKAMAKEGKIALFKHSGIFHCMDTLKDYQELNALWRSGNAKWKVWKD